MWPLLLPEFPNPISAGAVWNTMENPYLIQAVGKPLTQCLQELVEHRPNDPIEWIAHWLYKYTDNELYFYEKALHLKEMEAMWLEIQQERATRAKRRACLTQKLNAAKSMAGEGGLSLDMLKEMGLAQMARGSTSSKRSKTSSSSKKSIEKAEWKLNCQWGLICEHPVLGDMEPRPPLVYPETPEWWERQGYIAQTLYDHEVYSRDNSDTYPDWDKIEHMTYKDFVQEGPWLSEGALRNMQESLQDLYKMPSKFVKHKHKPNPDDKEFPHKKQ